MESATSLPARRSVRGLVIKLGALALVGAVLAVLVLRGVDVRALVEEGLALARQAGPGIFFVAMAILPAVGAPVSPFTLSAAPLFAPVIGLGWVFVATFAAIAVNVLLCYAMAAWAVRPVLEKLVMRLGYTLPRIPPSMHRDWTVLIRVTPGAPFFVQSYLLGLARVPLRIYLVVSLTVSWAYSAAFIVFGDAVVQGEGRRIVLGVSLLIVVVVGVQLVRKHLARRKARELAE